MILTRLKQKLLLLLLVTYLAWAAFQAAELNAMLREARDIGDGVCELRAEQIAIQDMMAVEFVSAPDAKASGEDYRVETQTLTLREDPEPSCPEPRYTEHELEMIAKTVWGEARGCHPDEQRLVVWTIFQQVDDGDGFAEYNTITDIITKPHNFAGYREAHPVDQDIYALVCEEADKWNAGESPPTLDPYAPTAPYLFFDGDGKHNWFRKEWKP